MRVRVFALFAAVFAAYLWIDARAQSGGPTVSGAHRFEKVAEGVYYATSAGTMNVGANSPIFVNDDEVLMVESSITPAAARAMVNDIKAITNKPIRYVVDSHYHYDHAHGNQVFISSATVIGHENTYKRLQTNVLEQYTFLTSVQPVPARVDGLKQRLAQEKDPEQKAAIERQIKSSLDYLEQVKETKVTPPNLTLDRRMTLYRGSREIQIIYLGRGHTDTDVVVYLPKERMIATGDLMESVISYMGDSYPDEWIGTLDRLRAIDFDTVLPGHGVVFKGKERIVAFQAYLRDLITQVNALRKQGLSAEDAAQKVDLRAHSQAFPQIRAAGVDAAAVRRIYTLADKPEPPQ
jgi:cyclase